MSAETGRGRHVEKVVKREMARFLRKCLKTWGE